MGARLTTFAYPWDLRRVGVEEAVADLAAHGFDAMYLAATYHPVDSLSPRGGSLRLYSSGRGAVHFPTRPDRYGRIEPSLSTSEICAVWPEVTSIAAAAGVAVIPWIIVLYQPWIVDRHPGCARVLPSGDPIDAGACPANDDVREYLVALCDDLVDQYGVETLHLEGIAVPTYDYGWLRPRVLVDVPGTVHDLLNLCFCPSCRHRGAAAGLDVDRLQRRVDGAIGAAVAGSADAGSLATALYHDAEVMAFAALYLRASVELAQLVARAVDPRGVRLSGLPWLPFAAELAPGDSQYGELLAPFGQVIVRPDPTDARMRIALAQRADRGLELGVLVAPSSLLSRPPDSRSQSGTTGGQTSGSLSGAAAIDADEIAIYNYGLLRDSDVQRMLDEQGKR